MPIDKFGRHMLAYRLKPYPTTSPVLTATEDPAITLSSLCVIQIRGVVQKTQHNIRTFTFYILDDGTVTYTLPISGTIESIHLPANVTMFLNNDNYDSDNKNLSKGDDLSFSLPAVDPKPPLFVEIVLRCPLLRNE